MGTGLFLGPSAMLGALQCGFGFLAAKKCSRAEDEQWRVEVVPGQEVSTGILQPGVQRGDIAPLNTMASVEKAGVNLDARS